MHLSNRQLFLQHVAQTSPAPVGLEIVSAKGVYLKDVSGKEYIDLISGISVSNIGHCHPAVVEAIKKQVSLLGSDNAENFTMLDNNTKQSIKGAIAEIISAIPK